MNDAIFERLLYEEESTTLDFKKEQYRFVKATDEEKSELLKDILGFANAWRRSEAYILIGVEDVRGGRGNVVGIAAFDHLLDHSLQQFVNNLLNRPIRFHYEAFGLEGKQVGIIRIEEQTRPHYLKRDFGKLKKGEVYVRRGSSTDPTKPADPDEIVSMGSEYAAHAKETSIQVEFAELDREQLLGTQIEWPAELCQMPDRKDIPTLKDKPASIGFPGGRTFHIHNYSSIGLSERLNSRYYHDLVDYIFFQKLFKKVRLAVINRSEVLATDVRLEFTIINGQGYGIIGGSDVPALPKRNESIYSMPSMKPVKFRFAYRPAGDVVIDKHEDQIKVEIECGSLQPGRKIWTDAFYMGIGHSGEIELVGNIFAANLSQPKEFKLSINATITESSLSVEDLIVLDAGRSDAHDE